LRETLKRLLRSLALLLLCSAAAFGADLAAPSHVRILVYGVDDVAKCAGPVKALQAELQTLPYPEGWTIGIVCNPLAWESLLRIADPPPTRTAFTNFIKHSTVINAAIFHEVRSSYRHTLAHELAHVTCQCADERKVDQMARKLERIPPPAQSQQAATVTAAPVIGSHGGSTP
jgi:hypothetical protein